MTRIMLLTTAIVAGLVAADGASAFGGPMGADQRPTFAQLDADGDGKVTQAEFDAYRATRSAERFKAADADGDGKLTAEELAAQIQADQNTFFANRAQNMVTRLDTDKDGFVSQAEAEAAMGQGRRATAPGQRMIQFADTDGDGAISEEEFNAAQANMQQRAGRFDGKRGGHGPRGDRAPFWRN